MAVNDTLSSVAVSDYNAITKAINTAQTQVDLTYTMLQNMEKMAVYIQMCLGLKLRWEIGSVEYLHYKDEVERLVVMCLFELLKLLMSCTGICLIFLFS